MENWKNKFRKKKQKFTSDKQPLEDALPVSGQDLIGDEWQKVEEDFAYESTDNDSGSPRFADDEDDSRNFITLDELSNPDEHVKARERLVKLEELRESEPHQSKNMKIDGNRIEAKCQEFRKPCYMTTAGIISFFVAGILGGISYLIPDYWAIAVAIVGGCLILLALTAYMSTTTVSVWLDENRHAVMSCSGFFTDFEPKKICQYELFYHLHEGRYGKKSFLHLDLQFDDKRFFSVSGKTFESLRNDRASGGAEDLQTLSGEYAIQQIGKLLGKARNCKRV